MSPARAYEADIHYSATYVLARAVGWTEADALTIASANQAMDENPDTVAALEVDAAPTSSLAGLFAGSLRQAERNLAFHCFSRTREQGARISADVLEVVASRFAEVPDLDEGPQKKTRRLIALGVALHCQQDAFSHVGFGGSCGSYSGSCYGHTHETFLDQVVFGLLKKHYFNPDHPGVSGRWLLDALKGTASALAMPKPGNSLRSIPDRDLIALSKRLRDSGLELPDEVRRECNRYIAGKWLLEFLQSSSRTKSSPNTLQRLAPQVALTCSNASLASATVLRIPDPRLPRLNHDASPYRVRADGTYQQVHDGDFDVAFRATGMADATTSYPTHRIKVQLSHWRQLLALGGVGGVRAIACPERADSIGDAARGAAFAGSRQLGQALPRAGRHASSATRPGCRPGNDTGVR